MQNPFRQPALQGGNSAADKPKPEWTKVLQGIAFMPLMLGGVALVNYVGEAIEGETEGQPYACTASLDGSMSEFALEVKYDLRDPDSFEHIQSFPTAVGDDGMQRIRMKFRARNGFGGMNVEMAEAVVQNSGCKLISWRIIG